MHEHVLRVRRDRLGLDNPDTAFSMRLLAEAYLDAGRIPDALRQPREYLPHRSSEIPPQHGYLLARFTAAAADLLGRPVRHGRNDLVATAPPSATATSPTNGPRFRRNRSWAPPYSARRNMPRPSRCCLPATRGWRNGQAQSLQPDKARLSEAVDWLIDLYDALGKPAETAKWRAERADLLWALADAPGGRIVPDNEGPDDADHDPR